MEKYTNKTFEESKPRFYEIFENMSLVDEKVVTLIELKGSYIDSFCKGDLEEKSFYFNMFKDEFEKFPFSRISNLSWHKFNIMPPIGGPWYIENCCRIVPKQIMSTQVRVEISGDTVGYVPMLENSCGIDNLITLAGFTSRWCIVNACPKWFYFDEYICTDKENKVRRFLKENFYGGY